MSVWSIDPGDSTGLARWTDDGILWDKRILVPEEMLNELALAPRDGVPSVIVFEDYRLDYRASKQRGSVLWASQVIGAIKLFATMYPKTQLVAQPNTILTIAQMHSGIKPPSNHKLSHDIDAVLHGWYYWECVDVEPNTAML